MNAPSPATRVYVPLSRDLLQQERDQYSTLRENLIAQTNAVTGKIDLLDELINRLPPPATEQDQPDAAVAALPGQASA